MFSLIHIRRPVAYLVLLKFHLKALSLVKKQQQKHIIAKKAVSHVINSRALTGEKPCINKAIRALLMHGYVAFSMIVPGPQICCRYEICTARP